MFETARLRYTPDMTQRSNSSTIDRKADSKPSHPPAQTDWPDGGREAKSHGPETIPVEHRASVERGLADLRAGRIATDEEVEAVYRRFGR